jgi:hypothetical protein
MIQTMAPNITYRPFMAVSLLLIPMGYLSLMIKTPNIMTFNGSLSTESMAKLRYYL